MCVGVVMRPSVPSSEFQREQQVQHTIAILQKVHRLSIFQIDVAAIRDDVRHGKTPHEIAVQWFAVNKPVQES